MSYLRFSRRMGEYRLCDSESACAVTRYKRRIPASEVALYIVGVVGIITALVFNQFGA